MAPVSKTERFVIACAPKQGRSRYLGLVLRRKCGYLTDYTADLRPRRNGLLLLRVQLGESGSDLGTRTLGDGACALH